MKLVITQSCNNGTVCTACVTNRTIVEKITEQRVLAHRFFKVRNPVEITLLEITFDHFSVRVVQNLRQHSHHGNAPVQHFDSHCERTLFLSRNVHCLESRVSNDKTHHNYIRIG